MGPIDNAIVYLWAAKIEAMIARSCTNNDFELCHNAICALGKFIDDNKGLNREA
jgi:hypothetical protein